MIEPESFGRRKTMTQQLSPRSMLPLRKTPLPSEQLGESTRAGPVQIRETEGLEDVEPR